MNKKKLCQGLGKADMCIFLINYRIQSFLVYKEVSKIY